ncbi:TPA: 5'-nucleotidase [Yersinia enterocolitica]|nr:5'-nucleotidase [Yersinia enterocolitica]UYK15506.1 5'-nucleotidase [Yersinia enterocolitica]
MNNIEELREHCEEMIAISRMQYAYIPASSIITLIDRIEKAEKERDDLLNQEFQQRLANAKYQLHMKDLAIHNIKASRMAQFKKRLAAEAALSAANEKLKGEQVPVAVIVLSKNWPDTGRKVIDYYIEKIQHLPVGTELFTAPQKPVVLSSSTVMSRAYVVQAIKAAGFTVEGE